MKKGTLIIAYRTGTLWLLVGFIFTLLAPNKPFDLWLAGGLFMGFGSGILSICIYLSHPESKKESER